ncbi:glycosyltransferase family 2 protein [Flavobacterium sp. 3HN19-14]|uniref:glycosyltransferase family 2 protein n=1 Tax=Flavobacterium sp. 3HN19-14 TaxID=3448133 RepID=UPI003EE014B6
MKLSVVILNYNVRYFLELCVLSVQQAIPDIDAEIIVVDNNSPDDSCEMIKSRFRDVRLIENKENSGFPKGNNIGVAAAKGEYICILNPDTVVAEDTFSKILAFAEKQNNLGITGCKLIDGTGNFLPESKRGLPTPFISFTRMSGLYKLSPKLFGKYYASHLSENETGEIDILVGAFMLMKRDLYNEIGGFDEQFFMYGEDIDLSYSAIKSGKTNYYFHETSVIHYKGESTIKDEKYRKNFRDGMAIFYKKHFSGYFSFLLEMGMNLFASAKKSTALKQQNKIPENYILISDDENLQKRLASKFQKIVTLLKSENQKALFSQTFSEQKNAEVIFDNNAIAFKDCISVMQTLRNGNFTFKILPKNRDFIIGSNSSDSRGEVIKL